MRASERVALRILVALTLAELVPVIPPLLGVNFGFLHWPRAVERAGTAAGWTLAAAVTAAYVAGALRDDEIRRRVGTRGVLRVAAVALALSAGLTEELFFRSFLMNGEAAAGRGAAVQVAVSAVTFGLAHGIWGFFGGLRTAAYAIAWTSALGLGLALAYVAGGRAVLPCIVAHVTIDLVLEPALILSALERRRGGTRAVRT